MGCWSATKQQFRRNKYYYFSIILFFSLLVINGLLSRLKFSECRLRPDLPLLFFNGVLLAGCVSAFMSRRRTELYIAWIRNRTKKYVDLMSEETEAYITAANYCVESLMKACAFLPGLSLLLQAWMSLGGDEVCYDQLKTFSVVWVYLLSCTGTFVFLFGLYWLVSSHLRCQTRQPPRNRVVDVSYNQICLRAPRILAAQNTTEKRIAVVEQMIKPYANLQDYQKESLLPIFVLYAMDELTWELRDGSLADKTIREVRTLSCEVCGENFDKSLLITGHPIRRLLYHRSCLRRLTLTQEGREAYLNPQFVTLEHLGFLCKVEEGKFGLQEYLERKGAELTNE